MGSSLGVKKRIRLKRNTRVRIQDKPEWGSSFYGWALNYLKQNKWRCDPLLDLDDLIQDAYLVFENVTSCYPRILDQKHFMALFKSALKNSVFDKQRKERKRINSFGQTMENIDEVIETLEGEYENYGPLISAINKASPELKMLLEAFSDDEKLELLRAPLRKRKGQPRDNLNIRFNKILGLEKRVNLVSELKNLF